MTLCPLNCGLFYRSNMYEIKIEGLDNLLKQLQLVDLSKQQSLLNRVAKRAMRIMQDKAIKNARFKSPDNNNIHLRDNIKLRIVKGSKSAVHIELYTTRKVRHYARLLEFGREPYMQMRDYVYNTAVYNPFPVEIPRMKPEPFMRPAYYSEKENVINEFKIALAKAIKSQLKRQAKAK